MTNALDKALALADLGIYVFPVSSNKLPTIPKGAYDADMGGFYHASNNPDRVRQLWADYPGQYVGYWVGASNLLVLDTDWNPDKGKDGYYTLHEMGHWMDHESNVRYGSPSGGEHNVFRVTALAPAPAHPLIQDVDRKSGASYAIWYGDVPSVRDWLELPAAPEWMMGGPTSYARDKAVTLFEGDLEEWRANLSKGPAAPHLAVNAPHHGDLKSALAALTRAAVYYPATPGLGEALDHIVESFMNSSVTSVAPGRRAQVVTELLAWNLGVHTHELAEMGGAAVIEWATNPPAVEEESIFPPFDPERIFTPEEIHEMDFGKAPERVGLPVNGELEVLSLTDLMNRPAPEWWVMGMYMQSTVGLFAGVTGIGKSFMMLHMAGCVAAGVSFFGQPVKQGKVLYVVAEGAASFGKRAAAMQDYHHIAIPEENIGFVESGVNLSDIDSMKRMARALEKHQPDIIILDTLSQLAAVDNENDAAQLSAVMRTARQIREVRPGSTVIIVHHVNKASGTVRGSSAIKSNVDTVVVAAGTPESFMISTGFDKDGKQKDGGALTMESFSLIDHMGTAVVDYTPAKIKDPIWEAVKAVLGDGEKHKSADVKAATKLSKNAAAARLKRYVDDGLLLSEGEGSALVYWLPDLLI